MKQKIVKLCDWHVPFHDDKAIQVAFKLLEKIKPTIIVVDEIHDFYSASRFDKDPTRLNLLQDEIDIAEGYLELLRNRFPESRIVLLNSNHLDRLNKYLVTQASGLAGLRCLEIETLLNLKKYDIEFAESLIIDGVLFKHGDVVRGKAGYSAKGELDRERLSGYSGHTHRGCVHFETATGGDFFWVEGGCLCKTDMDYIKGTANWQQGISVCTIEEDFIYPEFVLIKDYKAKYGNEIIG